MCHRHDNLNIIIKGGCQRQDLGLIVSVRGVGSGGRWRQGKGVGGFPLCPYSGDCLQLYGANVLHCVASNSSFFLAIQKIATLTTHDSAFFPGLIGFWAAHGRLPECFPGGSTGPFWHFDRSKPTFTTPTAKPSQKNADPPTKTNGEGPFYGWRRSVAPSDAQWWKSAAVGGGGRSANLLLT